MRARIRNSGSRGTPIRRRRSRPAGLTLIAATCLIAAVLLSGCGSSKPSYCSSVSNLEKSVGDLKSVNVISGGTSGLSSALQKVQSSAKTAVSDAKSDFPSQTTDVTNSLSALSNSVKQISGTPSAGAIAQIATQVSASVSAIQNFVNATKSKCS
jgi:PBP1b-binding outer membrane lipoprotein LpoB